MTSIRLLALVMGVGALTWACYAVGTPPPQPPAPTVSAPVPILEPPEAPPEPEADKPRAASDDLSSESLSRAIATSLRYFAGRPPDQKISIGGVTCNVFDYRLALEVLHAAAERGEPLQPKIREYFRVFRTASAPQGALFTGYYEPFLEARTEPEGNFVYPIFRRPDDLVEVALGDFALRDAASKLFGQLSSGRLAPYHSRNEIDVDRVLDGQQLEIAWVDDPVERFFLHIQGSGILRFADGSTQRIGYAGNNGRPYTSIGKRLLAAGRLGPGEASAPGIKRFLRRNLDRLDEILAVNERYIFFRTIDKDGPVGAIGEPLTAGRSLAADLSRYPRGALAFFKTEVPILDDAGEHTGTRPVGRFALIHDTGAAIKGEGRFDIFFGSGARKGLEAGTMHARGELLLLIPDCQPTG